MSFWTVVKEDASDIENAVVDGAKTVLNYVDNVFVTEIEPALEQVLKEAIEKLGQLAVSELLSKALGNTVVASSDAPADQTTA